MATKKAVSLKDAKSCCKNCGAFVLFSGQRDMGECRLNPPHMYIENGLILSSSPPVPDTHWCLQFKAMN